MAAGAGTVTIKILGDAKSALASFGEVGAGSDGLASKLSGMGTAALATGAVVATAVVGIGTELFKIGDDFDTQYDKIRVGTGAVGGDLDVLKDEFRKVVSDVPTDFAKAGDAVTVVEQKLGLAGDTAAGLAEQFLELSRITKTDLATNLQAGTDALNNWGTVTADQPRLLDEMFRATQLTGISFADLAGQMSDTGLVLRGLGFSIDDTIGILSMLKTAGLDAGDVMPSLSKALSTAAKEGKNAGDLFRETFDAITSGAPGAEQAAVKLFGAKGAGKFIELIKEGKFDYRGLLDTIQGGSDTIRGAGEDTQHFSEKWELFKNRVLVALEPIAMRVFDGMGKLMDKLPSIAQSVTDKFDEIRPTLEKIGDVISSVLNPVIGFFIDHWDQVKIVLLVVGGIIGGVLLAVFASFALSTLAVVAAFAALVAGAALLIQGLQWVWDHTEAVRDILGKVASIATDFVVTAFQAVFDAAQTVTTTLIDLWNASEPVRQILGDVASIATDFLLVAFDQVKQIVTDLALSLIDLWNASDPVRDILGKVASVATSLVVGAFDAVSRAVSTVNGWFQTLWDKSDGLREMFAGIFSTALNALGGVFDQLRGAVDWLWSSIQRVIDAAQTAIDLVSQVPGVDTITGGGYAGSIASAHSGSSSSHVGVNAAGTDNWRGGLSWVGEKGPELLNLPGGSQIIPNNRAMAMAMAGGSGGVTFAPVINVSSLDPSGAARAVGEALREFVRTYPVPDAIKQAFQN